jgi:uncharacterized phiE125 gp8 family phage protein
MSTILTTPPAAEPLSLAEAKAHLRIAHNDDDAFLSTLIITVRRVIEQRYSLCLNAQGWSVFLDLWPDNDPINLPLYPVQSINDVKIYGEDDVAATLDPAHYFLDTASKPSRLTLRLGRVVQPPGRRANGIEIKLTTGFVIVPQQIKQAMLIIIADYYSNRGDGENGAIPLSALELLMPYRDVRLT